jgi:CxxC motif-containing protein (DUF1111 family)
VSLAASIRARLLSGIALVLAGAAHAASPGGDLTRAADNRNAFALPAPALGAKELRDFNFGNRLFNTNWVVAPASVDAFDGLGPTFNRVSCSGCHLRDGRGRPPIGDETELLSMLLRLSIPGRDEHGGPKPHPTYGDQLNDRAIPGVTAEGRAVIRYRDIAGRYDDGTPYSLRAPDYSVDAVAFGALGEDLMISPRVAPHMLGMGLLEQVPEADVIARADPDDADADGISGRANRVWNPITQRTELGRFGWKANAATLRQQTAAAANGDIGLTSRAFARQNCPAAQVACAASHDDAEPELSEAFLDKLVFYLRTLAVPARRNEHDVQVQQGRALFSRSGCESCHVPLQRTAARAEPPQLSTQEFTPYTDLLLHDMGDGLADGRPDFLADGREWRTAPLWGLGLVPTVNDHTFFLHDGRARNLEEAILWHGGEAASAQRRFLALARSERDALLAFLQSL